MKQETLEEVAIRFYKENKLGNVTQSFIEGAKWQQERSYSEEEVIDVLEKFEKKIRTDKHIRLSLSKLGLYKWFEQFKKK